MASSAQRVLNKRLSNLFRMRGMTPRPGAIETVLSLLKDDADWEDTLHSLMLELQEEQLDAGHVDAAAVSSALAKLSAKSADPSGMALQVFSAFEMPPLRHDKARKCFINDPDSPSLFAPADAHATMYTNRLHLLEQRVRRHDMFKAPILANSVDAKQYLQPTSIDALLGRTGTHVVLGMLSELEEGRVFLEDAHANIELDVSTATTTAGLFTKGSIVLAEGEVLPSGLFKVSQLGFPPPEPRARSIEAMGAVDILPTVHARPANAHGSSANRPSLPPSAAALQNAMVVVLSDVTLDKEEVLQKLEIVFSGYETVGAQGVRCGKQIKPLASFFTFILCGNFTHPSFVTTASRRGALMGAYANLSKLLSNCPALSQNAHFVLIPGPDDPTLGGTDVLPRASLPHSLCAPMVKGLAHCHLASNPARIAVCGQMITVFREDLLTRARRCTALPPNDDVGTLNEHLIKTVMDNAHLFPLPATELPVYWKHDHALWLHPSPDVLILADRGDLYTHTYHETVCFNPGTFAPDFSWMVYRPGTRTVEASSMS